MTMGLALQCNHKLIDDTPFRHQDRVLPHNLISEVRKIIENWLKAGIIRESQSPYASQIALARKKNGEIRVCVDFRELNKRTVVDSYPLPRMDQCLNALKNSQFYSTLRLSIWLPAMPRTRGGSTQNSI